MSLIQSGDRVRIKDRQDWPITPGYRLACSEGVVIKWIDWDEIMEQFQAYIMVKIENSHAQEFIGNSAFFLASNLEKIKVWTA